MYILVSLFLSAQRQGNWYLATVEHSKKKNPECLMLAWEDRKWCFLFLILHSETVVLKVTWLTIIAAFPGQMSWVFLLSVGRQFSACWSRSFIVNVAFKVTYLLVKYLLEVCPFPQKPLFQRGRTLVIVIIKEEMKWKESPEAKKYKNTKWHALALKPCSRNTRHLYLLGFFYPI